MASDNLDRQSLRAHQDWLGFLQPEGLVVAPTALVEAQAFVDVNVADAHAAFLAHVRPMASLEFPEPVPGVLNFATFAEDVLGWPADRIVRDGLPEPYLAHEREPLRPTFGIREGDGWLLLGEEFDQSEDLDATPDDSGHGWAASRQAKFERLLRESRVPIGLLFNRAALRLVYAPAGESSGHLTFPFGVLAKVEGRIALAALRMLLSRERLFTLPPGQLLPDLLARSRKYQNTVSTELAGQVLAALFELVRGFQIANDRTKGELLRDILRRDPNQVYGGLLTVLMRLVFLLYAEDRGLMSDDSVYLNHYSVTGLFEELREDEARFPDTMDQRYGSWARLVALFRLAHDGGAHGTFRLPARKGTLFDPSAYPFLESAPGDSAGVPMVPDGTVFRVLRNLLVLDGERLSYRALDVEQIGSVYEAIMGFRLETATGPSVAIKPTKSHGAPVTINLDDLLAQAVDKRAKWLKEQADQTLTGQALAALKQATTREDLAAAMEKKIAQALTPAPVPAGAMVLQPSDERRRSGSHYTPRTLTEPIVRKALKPVLQNLGERPTPDLVLGLKVCDLAMGSGAFLVEACRQLGDALVEAWHAHGVKPVLPAHEDEVLYARRLVAQRCLYGVDKNPMAVGLAKLSLWLATLAKDHPFTFLDHALKHGDSLVGLTREQITRFHWKQDLTQVEIGHDQLIDAIRAATEQRTRLLDMGDSDDLGTKRQILAVADERLNFPRRVGDLVVAAFFSADNDKKRQAKREELLALQKESLKPEPHRLLTKAREALYAGEKGIRPFHWEIEFPEVFGRPAAGFDGIVGNPPFMGGMIISTVYGDVYRDWLYRMFPESGNRMDLVAYFFRQAFSLLRNGGTLGLLATNTIAQGDTREGGLRILCNSGGVIYSASRRYRWPGLAAVVVSVIHMAKGGNPPSPTLDGRGVPRITAFLFHAGGNESPAKLDGNLRRCSIGTNVLGMGFTFDDSSRDSAGTSLAEMNKILATPNTPPYSERVFPFVGGEEVNNSPDHSPHRHIINFEGFPLEIARKWPLLLRIVEERVKPQRDESNRDAYRTRWWQFGERQSTLYESIRGMHRVLANCQVSPHMAFAFLPATWIYAHTLNVFAMPGDSTFCVLQSRIHEVWVRFFGSSMKDDLRYTPTDCFETFPFPEGFEANPALEAGGKAYCEFRAALMIRANGGKGEGLTKTYNRFHDPAETSADILRLRELHAAMDRAVLDAYGGDLAKLTVPPCEFLLDYDDEEDESEPSTGRQKKKPWRYRWPDAFRDEVLALLLELNKQRAAEESGSVPSLRAPAKQRRRAASGEQAGGDLFGS